MVVKKIYVHTQGVSDKLNSGKTLLDKYNSTQALQKSLVEIGKLVIQSCNGLSDSKFAQ